LLVWGSSVAQVHHMRWFEAHLPGDGSVAVERLGMRLMGLMLAGPKARDVLAALTDHDVANAAFRFMDHRAMDVAGCPGIVNRLSYTGDLGYEIWVEPCYLRTLYRGVQAAGAEHGLVDFGMRALLSMRLEKNWPTWFAELRPIYGAFEAGMERFVKLSKRFIGRDAAAREAESGPRLRRVSLAIEAGDADVMGDEPIWARAQDHVAVAPGHGIGAPRFDADGRALPKGDARRDGDWRVVGWVTSGGYGHSVRLSLAQGYLPAALADREEAGLYEVELLGVRRPARILVEPPFDPEGTRMRA
jgi:dimethylglycine dehydrogenase